MDFNHRKSRKRNIILHGGPGLAAMPLYNEFLEPLSKQLMIVNWDQRGAGKSYRIRNSKQNMNLDQFVSDAVELIRYLKSEYKKDKIFLLGHSWGSALGILVCQKHPELIHKYFGVGQIENWSKGELISYNFIQAEAKRLNDRKAQKRILKMGKPSHSLKNLVAHRNLLMKYGGAMYKERRTFNSF